MVVGGHEAPRGSLKPHSNKNPGPHLKPINSKASALNPTAQGFQRASALLPYDKMDLLPNSHTKATYCGGKGFK